MSSVQLSRNSGEGRNLGNGLDIYLDLMCSI